MMKSFSLRGSPCGGNNVPLLVLFLILFHCAHARFFPPGSQGSEILQKAAKFRMTAMSKIGSRPPLCDRRCGNCSHCEAIQVPAWPAARAKHYAAGLVFRGDDGSSNYKPVSWKCKCGNLILNP